jgi:hypothetical protein
MPEKVNTVQQSQKMNDSEAIQIAFIGQISILG